MVISIILPAVEYFTLRFWLLIFKKDIQNIFIFCLNFKINFQNYIMIHQNVLLFLTDVFLL